MTLENALPSQNLPPAAVMPHKSASPLPPIRGSGLPLPLPIHGDTAAVARRCQLVSRPLGTEVEGKLRKHRVTQAACV